MAHNLDEQLAWLSRCQSWGEAFGACLDPTILDQRALPDESHQKLTLAGDWLPLWRRAAEGRLHGGDVLEKRRGGGARGGGVKAAGRQCAFEDPDDAVLCSLGPAHGQKATARGAQQRRPPQSAQRAPDLPGAEASSSSSSKRSLPNSFQYEQQAAGGYQQFAAAAQAPPQHPMGMQGSPQYPMGAYAPQQHLMGGQCPQHAGGVHSLQHPGVQAAAQHHMGLQAPAQQPMGVQQHPMGSPAGFQVPHQQNPPDLASFAFNPGGPPQAAAACRVGGAPGGLLEELTRWRKSRADAKNVKVTTVLTKVAMEAIAAEVPCTPAELGSLRGLKKTQVSEYGAEILNICQPFKCSGGPPAPQGLQPRPPATPQVTPATPWLEGPPPKRPKTGNVPKASGNVPKASGNVPKASGNVPKASGNVYVLPSQPDAQQVRRPSTPAAAQPKGAAAQPAPKGIISGPTVQREVLDRSMLTQEQAQAADRALKGESLFITGAAGTGKSFLLRYLIQELEGKHPGLVAITAPTGIAAVNIGGQTIHSFSGVGMLGDKLKEVARPIRYFMSRVRSSDTTMSRWRDTKILVIDEISMLEPDLFELLENVGREISPPRAFGGMQLLLCGDFLQLPPVDSSRDDGGRWTFSFETPAWSRCNLQRGTIILQQAVRQSGDPAFVQVLNYLRAGQFPPECQELCNRCLVSQKPKLANGIIPTRLYCTNRDVDQENNRELAALKTEARNYSSKDDFRAQRGSGSSKANQNDKKRLQEMLNKAVPQELMLKVRAQVILLRRQKQYGLVNGSRGIVTQLFEHSVEVKFDNGAVVVIEAERFQQVTTTTVGIRAQLPLKLGWALTVHKSQGMTISNAEVHLDSAFSNGQAYVALSRLTGFAGLWIGGRGLSQGCIRAHPKALAFYGMPAPAFC